MKNKKYEKHTSAQPSIKSQSISPQHFTFNWQDFRLDCLRAAVIDGGKSERQRKAADSFNPNVTGSSTSYVKTVVRQPDGKVLIGGNFTTVGGQPRRNLARVNADGTLDTTFTSPLGISDSVVYAIVLQTDGKILVAAGFNDNPGQLLTPIVRLNSDGTRDNSFSPPQINNPMYSILVQADGKILIGGLFTIIGTSPNAVVRRFIARLNSNGSIDENFNPTLNLNSQDTRGGGGVHHIIRQPDGKILIGGFFWFFEGISNFYRYNIARINTNGTFDSFDPGQTNGGFDAVTLQLDGKILIGGGFNSIRTSQVRKIARLNADGTIDNSFNAMFGEVANNVGVKAVALQADGKILVGGQFVQIGGQPRNAIARLNPNGTADEFISFAAIGSEVSSIVAQPDGKILVGGGFVTMGGQPRNHIARLYSSEIGEGTVSGRATYANSLTVTPIPFTTLNAVGLIPLSTTTDANGFYSSSGFGAGAYTITPSKTNQVNGISNLDASTVAQHIVGLTTLNANQIIAADASGNGTIGSLDAAYIAQFAASIPNLGTTGTWKFLPTSRSYPDVLTNQTNQDYSAILVGDVTGNWNPAGPLRPELLGLGDLTTEEEKTELPVAITAQRNQVAEEKTAFTVNLPAPELPGADVLGYQFDLLYDEAVILPQTTPCDTLGTISNGLSAVCNTTTPGLLKVVVFGTEPISGSGLLLKLNFNAVGMAGNMSPLIFQNFLFNEDTPSAITVNGSVLIVSPTPTSTPTPSGNVCTSITTFTEKDLFPGSLASFGVSSGALRLTNLTAEQGCNHSGWSILPMW